MRSSFGQWLCVLYLVWPSWAAASDDAYWSEMAKAMRTHPSYQAFVQARGAASSLQAIEEARRYPKFEGVLSRTDGGSSLSTSPSAWQAGVSMTYPLFDNKRQDARDRIAEHQGQLELFGAAQTLEAVLLDLANAHIRGWEASQAVGALTATSQRLQDLLNQIQAKVAGGEASLLEQSKFSKLALEVSTKLLDARQRLDMASRVWSSTGAAMPSGGLPPVSLAQGASPKPHAQLLRQGAQVEHAQAEYELALGDEGPSVNFQAASLLRHYNSIPGTSKVNTWQINAAYPFFDGGLAKSRTERQALNKATKQAELDAEKAKTDMELARLQAWLKSMSDILRATEQQCQLQKQIAANIAKRFELGRGSVLEVTESSMAAQDCELNLAQSKTDYFLRYHELSRMNGTLAVLILGESP